MNVLGCFFSLDLGPLRADAMIRVLSVDSGYALLFTLNLVLNCQLILETDLLLHAKSALRASVPSLKHIQLIFLSLHGQRAVNGVDSRQFTYFEYDFRELPFLGARVIGAGTAAGVPGVLPLPLPAASRASDSATRVLALVPLRFRLLGWHETRIGHVLFQDLCGHGVCLTDLLGGGEHLLLFESIEHGRQILRHRLLLSACGYHIGGLKILPCRLLRRCLRLLDRQFFLL
jgi:hypothetical protein